MRRLPHVATRPHRSWWEARTGTCCLMLMLVLPGRAAGQETAAFFKQSCYSCHTIGGGRLVGPDLKDVLKRKDRDWLVRFMLNPQAMIDRGDPYAKQILDEARGVVMTQVAGLTRDRANALLDLIETESTLEKSQFEGVVFSDRPFTQLDVDTGERLFKGLAALKNGGPPCISCHTVRGLGLLGVCPSNTVFVTRTAF